jgi:hypothetical protein
LPRYFLHIRSAEGTSRDEEGTDLTDLNAAKADALAAARELFAAAIALARDPMLKSIVITDEAGQELGEVRIRDLLPPSFWD